MSISAFVRRLVISTIFFCIASRAVLLGDNVNLHYVLPDRKAGLFSIFASVVGLLEFHDRSPDAGITVDFANSGFYYTPEKGPNWWNYYFEPIAFGSKENAQIVDINLNQSCSLSFYALTLPVARTNQIITKYIKVRPEIQAQVQDFIRANFQNSFVIGVHYRGTDKPCEAPQVPYASVAREIDLLMQKRVGKKKIFVATDEQAFLDFMRARYGNLVVYQKMQRSQDGKALHYVHEQGVYNAGPNAYQGGLEAVIDCLLLSHCNALFKTASNLSACSVMFNPKIEVYQLSTNDWEKWDKKDLYNH